MNNNKRATKRALLTSVMALVMCVVMLVGTTFAWFTDTASTGVNRIQAGNLKIALEKATTFETKYRMIYHEDEAGNEVAEPNYDEPYIEFGGWEDAENSPLNFIRSDAEGNYSVINDNNILWEPGCTFVLQPIRVRNDGNLALKYEVRINGGSGDLELLKAIKFDAHVIYDSVHDDTIFEDILNTGVICGGNLKEKDDTATISITAHMDENAGNEYQEKTLNSISITVVATQYTYENDSFGNQYDKYAQYGERTVKNDALVKTTEGQYAGVYGLANSQPNNVSTKNITYSIPAGNYDSGFYAQHFGINSTFDGNGSTFTGRFELNCGYVPTTEESTLVVSNLNVEGDLIITASSNNVVIYNCTANHISVLGVKDDISVTIDGCKITGTPIAEVGRNNNGNNKYGIYITRAAAEDTANVSIINSELSGIKGHAIAVQSSGGPCDFTIKGNTFTSYGLGNEEDRAAFKMWLHEGTLPYGADELDIVASDLARVIERDNSFATDRGNNCVVADFYGKTVAFW